LNKYYIYIEHDVLSLMWDYKCVNELKWSFKWCKQIPDSCMCSKFWNCEYLLAIFCSTWCQF